MTSFHKRRARLAFFLSFVLICANLIFLTSVAERLEWIMCSFCSGLNKGIIAFFSILILAVVLTAWYVVWMGKNEIKDNHNG